MEKSTNSSGESLEQMQPDFAAQQHGHAPSSMLRTLDQALLDSKKENQELAAENAALRQQLTSQEVGWEKERKKLLESAEAIKTKMATEREEMERRVKEMENNVRSLKQTLRRQQTETQKIQNLWKADQTNEMKHCFDIIKAEWQHRWFLRQEEVAAEFKTLKEEYDKKISNLSQMKEAAVSRAREDMMELLEEENLATMMTFLSEIHIREGEWETKHTALEDRLRCELVEELQKQSKDTEDKLLKRQEGWDMKERDLEDQIKLLIVQSIELQELALKSDKEKAKMKRKEKKAKKESEKQLKREMKEKEERERKEIGECEKKEK